MKATNNNNLMASIAVFAELCDSENDIRGILKEFIKSVFNIENIYSINVSEATISLKNHFNFEFPEAVLKTCLNSLKKDGFLERSDGKYHRKVSEIDSESFSKKLEKKRTNQKEIEEALVGYYGNFTKKKVSVSEKEELLQEFIHYLLDNGVSEKFSAIISSFVLENSKSKDFVKELNHIKEGLVLVTGLRYTNDIGKIGSWNDELTFYLDTEHLFNYAGYNGELYKKIFEDFFALINEINSTSKNKTGKDIIHLKFFEEVNDEIERFFYAAEKIVQGKDNMSPQNTAMEEICKGCSSVADIVRKKAEFERDLKTKGITLCKKIEYLEDIDYNIIDGKTIDKYNKKLGFGDEEVLTVLRSFSMINYLREGRNRVRFEKCGHIILTGKYLTQKLSRDLMVKNEKKDIPFATDINFVTNRFWYTLNKGFSKENSIPASFDVVSKAQLALASLRNQSIVKRYSALKKELNEGTIDRIEAQEFYHGLREKAKKPEEITSDQIDESLDIIFDTDVEKYLREKSTLKEELKIKEKNIDELRNYKIKEETKKRRRLKRKAMILYWACWSAFFVMYLFLVISIGYLIYLTTNQASFSYKILETILTLIPFIISVIPLYKNWAKIKSFMDRIAKNRYRKLLKTI